jgi:O-antigen ligase
MMLFLLTVINVSRVHQSIPALAALRPGLLLVLAAAAYAFLNAKSLTRANILQFWPMRRVVLLAVLACLSVPFGIALGKSASFILDNYSKTIVYTFLIALSVRNVRDLYTMVWAMAVSAGILVFFSLFVFGLQREAIGHTARLSNLHTYDANDVCVVILVGLAMVLLLMQVAKFPQKILLVAILAGIGATIARAGSRGGFLGLVAFGAAALVFLSGISVIKRGVFVIVVVIGMVSFAPQGYWEQMATILQPTNDYNYASPNGRKALAQRGMHYMWAKPLFGVGISNFGKAECDVELSGIKTGAGGTRCGAPHNSYVQAGAELGVTGLLTWLSIVLGGIWAMLKLRRKLPRTWRRGAPAERFMYNAPQFFALGLVGFSVSAFFVSFAWMELVYIQAALMTGLYLSVAVHQAHAADAPPGEAVLHAASRQRPGWRVFESAQRNGVPLRMNNRAGTT